VSTTSRAAVGTTWPRRRPATAAVTGRTPRDHRRTWYGPTRRPGRARHRSASAVADLPRRDAGRFCRGRSFPRSCRGRSWALSSSTPSTRMAWPGTRSRERDHRRTRLAVRPARRHGPARPRPSWAWARGSGRSTSRTCRAGAERQFAGRGFRSPTTSATQTSPSLSLRGSRATCATSRLVPSGASTPTPISTCRAALTYFDLARSTACGSLAQALAGVFGADSADRFSFRLAVPASCFRGVASLRCASRQAGRVPSIRRPSARLFLPRKRGTPIIRRFLLMPA